MPTLDATISGHVQGVGFRAFVRREASALGLSGSVWNEDRGPVRVRASGARADLERLAALLRRGPAHSTVRSVDLAWSEGESEAGPFRVGFGDPR